MNSKLIIKRLLCCEVSCNGNTVFHSCHGKPQINLYQGIDRRYASHSWGVVHAVASRDKSSSDFIADVYVSDRY